MSGAESEIIQVRLDGRLGDFRLEAEADIPARGVTALIGPSGSGKSTLLRCIAGLTRLDGRVAVKGEAWQDEGRFRPTHLRPVGYVFQEPSLLPHLSVRRNLMFGHERTRSRSKIAPEEVIELLGVEPLLHRSPDRLSGGERQRVAIGRALLSQPELLLMDEPVSSLDADSKAEILPYLERLHQALKIPVIYVSHDAAEVSRLADRVLEMRQGRIHPAARLERARPAGPADMNVVDAERRIAELDFDEVWALAVAAVMAGLKPARLRGMEPGGASSSPPPGSRETPSPGPARGRRA